MSTTVNSATSAATEPAAQPLSESLSADPPVQTAAPSVWAQLRRALKSVPVMIALALLSGIVLIAVFAPFLGTTDPNLLNPGQRLKVSGAEFWLGSDGFGRDVYSRVLYGARTSLIAGLGAALISITVGLLIGVITGYFRTADAIIMRIMDGLMAIPGILLAIALVSLSGASLFTVVVAITIPEIPRVARLVRSVILTVRGEPYVEAAISLGTPVSVILLRHLVPNTLAPLIVLGTYIFASAILTEAILSFLGVGLGSEVSSWGNIISEGRMYLQMRPGLILYPGIFLSLTVLSVNLLGDAMRDALDPRMARIL